MEDRPSSVGNGHPLRASVQLQEGHTGWWGRKGTHAFPARSAESTLAISGVTYRNEITLTSSHVFLINLRELYKPSLMVSLLTGLFSPFIFNVIPEAVALLVHHFTMFSCPLPPPAPFIYSLFKNFFHSISLLLLNYTSVYHSFDPLL